ncbi:bZIP transcription factor protein [Rutstroemia sp. NJR-2017a WRK4]|nr:bZIP transcription factor protein [Rutstroemia sp. NJR-2017a BBW]PQE08650.1 bZIP transcription factor protein [Rutstroemia sp. NJR-2017a BBW]PQE31586.1 bZIP transcription factor protein [Rutstroemia sp. NJR-2017a WRK4]
MSSPTSTTVPALSQTTSTEPNTSNPSPDDSPSMAHSSTSSSMDESGGSTPANSSACHTPTLKRPKLGTRKSSGTIIVPREHPRVELKEGDEVFDEDDARAMSPRRNSEDLEKMSQDARAQLNEHARLLQQSLLEIFNRIEAVKEEHDKLDNNNKFLQKYIGDLMSTSKITSTGAGSRKK